MAELYAYLVYLAFVLGILTMAVIAVILLAFAWLLAREKRAWEQEKEMEYIEQEPPYPQGLYQSD